MNQLQHPSPSMVPMAAQPDMRTWQHQADLAQANGGELPRVPQTYGGFGLQPPGAEFWAALMAAQSGAQELGEEDDVEIRGKKAYSYAGYKQFLREGRRLLHSNGLLLFQLGALSSPDVSKRRSLLFCTFVVVHAATGQGMTCPFEWPVHPTDKFAPAKATGASYSNSLRYFLRGLLLIPTGDGNREDPEAIYDGGHRRGGHLQQAYQHNATSYQQADVQHMQNTQQPQVSEAERQAAWAAYYAQQAGQQAIPQHGPQNGQQQPPTQGSQQPTQPQHDHYTATQNRHADAADQGEPTDNAGWCDLLTRIGYTPGTAEDFAVQPLGEPIHDAIANALHDLIAKEFGDDVDRARAAWKGTGFTPRPDLKKAERPKPTGLHTLRYLRNLKQPQKESHR